MLPWSNLPPAQAEQLKRQVMMLSHEKWNFMSPLNRDEPHGFEPYMVGQAKALLAVDPELNKMRFLLVPTKYARGAYTHTHTHTHTYTYTRTHARTHTHKHTHTTRLLRRVQGEGGAVLGQLL